MKYAYKQRGLVLVLIAALDTTTCQQSLTYISSTNSYEIKRLRRKNSHSPPYVFGTIVRHDSSGFTRPMGGCVILDKQITLCAKDNGQYAYPLLPGRHQLTASYLGSFIVHLTNLHLQIGDSVQVDFYLHDNPKSI